ncbi:type I-C CRISPR-associated endonuclease Cas1c [Veillonella sp.]|uniref:type I-C CRISPR-associated endonuclease Cas1c n=1 Tax=Veillonella sp. TaxID=1926307 RepID=UPI0025E96407|nr:type I-C CRISPR-associated endonuclease Cas1c [Veillonella sp.]
MKVLQNTLYVMTPDIYLATTGENVVLKKDGETLGRYPLHNIQDIVTFAYSGISPKLLERCMEQGIGIAFMTSHGRLISRMQGRSQGNILLRREQYRLCDDIERALAVAKHVITAKIYNEKWTLERYIRQYSERLDTKRLKSVSNTLTAYSKQCSSAANMAHLRGIEGVAQSEYFSVFDDMILNQKETFQFTTRSRRPPLDRVNALLSFMYSVLANDVASALESVGLDAYAGVMHVDRPGRISFALDLLEELRSPLVDRFVLSLINRKVVNANDFSEESNGAVLMNDEARRAVIAKWQERKKETLVHPFLEEKIPWGLVPFVQALLYARFLRGDLDAYPPFMWK